MKLSVIIPTYNEGENVVAITELIDKTLGDKAYEILFVDDSIDNTTQILQSLAKTNTHVKMLHRENERGLATAVIAGFEVCRGDVIAVMDADLQHPPGLLLQMLQVIEQDVQIVIPSRFIKGGSDGGLNLYRKCVSWSARMFGKLCVKKLRAFSDVTGGYFMFRKEVIEESFLDPVGWKILIEILVKGKYSSVVEIPYVFKLRQLGNSKMSFKEQKNYLCHLIRLIKTQPEDLRFWKFAGVGFLGMLVNLCIYTLLIKFSAKVVIAGSISGAISIISNFLLNDYFTWKGTKQTSLIGRFIKYSIVSIVGLGFNVMLLNLFYNVCKIHYLLANMIAIAIVMLWNYFGSSYWTFK